VPHVRDHAPAAREPCTLFEFEANAYGAMAMSADPEGAVMDVSGPVLEAMEEQVLNMPIRLTTGLKCPGAARVPSRRWRSDQGEPKRRRGLYEHPSEKIVT
jgi:hypothetical protein